MSPKHKQFNSDDDEDNEMYSEDNNTEGDQTAHNAMSDPNIIESDSDEEPEDISSTRSKAETIQQMKNIVGQMKKTKELKKQKNKKHAELFAAQKAARLEQLEKYRLPDELKEQLVHVSVGQKKESDNHPVRLAATADRLNNSNSSDEDGQCLDTETDFIPLNSNTRSVQVVRLKDHKVLSSSAMASEFKQKSLYGSRVRRVPVKVGMALTAKRRARLH